MDCNKEEAIRAKAIAENKMKNNDFAGARKIALRAQQLCQDLENISQMIMVCDVHCSAEKKLLGNEMDWYGILQVEMTADEASIRKQFRKYALQLHPDKNKFPGAETAFKLIGEAHRVLSDKGKRSLHDIKRQHTSTSRAASSYQPQNNFRSDFRGLNSQHQKQQQPQFTQAGTFWTMCPFCAVRYQYYRHVINTAIFCQSCGKSFVAYERGVQGVPTATNLGKPAFYQKKDVPNTGAFKVEQVFKGNAAADNYKTVSSQKVGCSSSAKKAKMNNKKGRKQVVESSGSCDTQSSSSDSEVNMKSDKNGDFQAGQNFGCYGAPNPRRSNRRKQQVCYQENLSDDDDLVNHPKRAKGSGPSGFTEKKNDTSNGQAPDIDKQSGSTADVKEEQKEAKQKETVSTEGSLSDRNKVTGKVSIEETVNVAGAENNSGLHANDSEKIFEAHASDCEGRSEALADSTSDSKSALAPEGYMYEDPDFNDFEKDRKEECFAVGQIWAVFDSHDAMPRFYARIRKVFPSGFKLRITWLEPDPVDENEIEWINEELPVSCGKFRNGSSENTTDRAIFSHLVSWEKGYENGTYNIFPIKGQTWGLFKDWNFNWTSDADSNRKYEYEFVEILSDYTEGVGVSVACLAKVKGFACVFCRRKERIDSFLIPPAELFRFSHMVPSVKLTGEERQDVPNDSFELDPASLPPNLEEIDVPVISKAEAGVTHPNGSCLGSADKVKPSIGSGGCTSGHQAEAEETCQHSEDDVLSTDDGNLNVPQASTPENIVIPEPEFYNFDADKSEDKLQVGQIWSLYSDEDSLPKYYGEIVKIKSDPVLEVHVKWLVSCLLPKGTIKWHDKKMPICCGRYKTSKDGMEYTSTGSFSHQLKAEPAGRRNEYNIFPSKGEIWALYRNWNAEIKCSDLENCEYDIVEILDKTELHIEVLFLEHMEGLNSVFRPQVEGSSNVVMEVPLVELLRFSHQIPAFRLSEERGGTLRGFWELDSAALPVHYFLH